MKRLSPRLAAPWLAVILMSVTVPSVSAQDPTPPSSAPTEFDKVEEDWELVVATPDPLGVGPQITTCMTPFAVGVAPFVAFNMNYRERPTFQPGGMQVQVWTPEGSLLSAASHDSAVFNTPNETLTWTQRMRLIGGFVFFDVQQGQSQTWGNFGQGMQLSAAYAASPTSLMGYDPEVSAARSGVTWQSNYVTRLVLKRVRYYANGNLIWTDETPRVIVSNASSDS
ncbi:MAG: hypothetical protein AB7I30_06305 [Isosphaeraceae bacterium]